MTMTHRQSLLIFASIAFWLSMPIAFVVIGMLNFHLDTNAASVHLRTVALILLSVISIKWVLFAIGTHWLSTLGSSFVSTLMAALMLSFYALALAGWTLWGEIPSIELLLPYATNLDLLFATLDLPYGLIHFLGGFFVTALLLTVYWHRRQPTIALSLYRRATPSIAIALIVLGFSSAFVVGSELHSGKHSAIQEPLSLFFRPLQWNLQGTHHTESSVAILDQAHSEARNAYEPALRVEPVNVILVAVDALRPHHLSIHGYHRPTTPFLSQLQKEGGLSTAPMHSSCAASTCGLLSILASARPWELSRSPFTLQEALARHGYRSHQILSGDHTNFYNLKQLYGRPDYYADGTTTETRGPNDDRLVIDYIRGLPSWDGTTPHFMHIHLMSAHTLGARWLEPAFTPSQNYALLSLGKGDVAPERRERAINYYDNGVVQTDATLKAIMDALGERNYLNNALFIVTADHGEALGEGGQYGHGSGTNESVLRIPFLMSRYKNGRPTAPSTANTMMSQTDIAPTVTHELRLPAPSIWSGRPAQKAPTERYTYFRQGLQRGLYNANRTGAYKYILDVKTGTESVQQLSGSHLGPAKVLPNPDPVMVREWRRAVLSPPKQ